MAKQIRYGEYKDFKPEKMVTAELACVTSGDPAVSDGRSVYVCFTPGIVKRLTTYADFERELAAESEEIRSQFTQDIKDAIQDALDAKNAAETFVEQKGQEIDSLITETQKTTSDFVQQAQSDVNTAVTSANASKQAADEATQKALDAADKANEAAGGDISEKAVTFGQALTRANVESGDTLAIAFGKLAKYCADLESGGASTLLGNNLEPSMALISNENGKISAHADVSVSELGYLNGATSNIQNQIGTLSSLATTQKSNLVNAVNELSTGKLNIAAAFLAVHPVGCIYFTVIATNPGQTYGGTWVAWGSGRVPVGVAANDANFNTVEKTGGASTVSYTPAGTVGNTTLTTAQIPAHAHSVNAISITSSGAHTHNVNRNKVGQSGTNTYITVIKTVSGSLSSNVVSGDGAHTHSVPAHNTNNNGSGGAHNHGFSGTATTLNNMQQYITCYMWKRTA